MPGRRPSGYGDPVSQAAIEFNGLSKSFGKVQAVHDLSFSVEFGRVTGFLGPNGAGKSTTLRTLLGLIHPHAGTATFGGVRYERLPHPSSHVGAVLEEASFHPGRSGRNHLRILAAAGSHPESRVSAVLEQVDLAGAADRRVKGYSMGMRQRLAIAAALLGDPDVLILDEPSNGLDPPGIRWMRDLLRSEAAPAARSWSRATCSARCRRAWTTWSSSHTECCAAPARSRACSAAPTAPSPASARATPTGSPRCCASRT